MNLIINQLDRNTDGDIVTTVHYSAVKQDGDFTASVYSTVGLEQGDTVIPFAEVTEEVVKTWLTEKLDMESLESALDAQIEDQKAPKVLSGLPWATE
jgi:hypothetical protein